MGEDCPRSLGTLDAGGVGEPAGQGGHAPPPVVVPARRVQGRPTEQRLRAVDLAEGHEGRPGVVPRGARVADEVEVQAVDIVLANHLEHAFQLQLEVVRVRRCEA